MSSSECAVFGIYRRSEAAGKAVDRFLSEDFSPSAISVLCQKSEGAAGIADRGFARLAGLAEFEIPDAGMFLAGGRIVTALSSAMAGGASESLAGIFIGMGVPEYEARLYEVTVKDGDTLLSVHCDHSQQLQAARGVLENTGAGDIASTIEVVADEAAGDRIEAHSLSAEEAREETESVIAGRGSPQPLKFKPDPAMS